MTASCVAMCGQVGWVGLLVPHVCRMIFGSSHARLLPAAYQLRRGIYDGGRYAGTTISAAEIPVSILTAIIGAPIFIAIVRKRGLEPAKLSVQDGCFFLSRRAAA